jgi:serine/threonine protein kinase
MALAAGTRIGPYEVVSLVGVGGMGEVYKARDSRLDRIVAIKILRADVAGRADRRVRFDKEARAITSLSPFRAGTPVRLFALGVGSSATRDRVRNTDYDVSPDGQKFLISIPVGQAASSQTTIVLNWPATLRR